LQHAAFRPGAYARAAFGCANKRRTIATCLCCGTGWALIASVRLTPVSVGERRGMLLGPLVVDPCCMGQGHGKALMRMALEKAREAGCGFVLLIGDAAITARSGSGPSRPGAYHCRDRPTPRASWSPSFRAAPPTG
jgi:predicted N-acetyltransferase YhbS